MNKRLNIIVGIVVALAIVTTAVVISHSKKNVNNMPPMSNQTSSQDAVASNNVSINNYLFSAATVKVSAGSTVTWTNQDDVHHTVTIDSGTGPNSQPFSKGQTFSYKFEKAGTYKYHCSIHPEMHGTVIVN